MPGVLIVFNINQTKDVNVLRFNESLLNILLGIEKIGLISGGFTV